MGRGNAVHHAACITKHDASGRLLSHWLLARPALEVDPALDHVNPGVSINGQRCPRLSRKGEGTADRRLDGTGLVWFGRMRNGPSLTVSESRIDKDRTGVAEDLDLGIP
jgi:hypothetical protein